jgi:hypothetical protein
MLALLVLCFALTAQATPPTSAECTSLCVAWMGNCSTTFPVYLDQTACETECMKYIIDNVNCPTGNEGAALCGTGNSYGCRVYHLGVAANGVAGNLVTHCPHGTPMSPATTTITAVGTLMGPCTTSANATMGITTQNGLIDDYCNNVITTCPGYLTANLQQCLAYAQYIPMNTDVSFYPGIDAATTFPIGGPTGVDSLACKRYHVTVAAQSASNAMTHCPHATTGNGQCGSDCDFYCDLVMGACPANYNSTATCMSTCANFATTATVDPIPQTGNTLQCRTYHAMVATTGATNAAIHCPHASAMSVPGICAAASGGAAGLSASLFLVAALSALSFFW